jgi:AraC-like DNA-binding protein
MWIDYNLRLLTDKTWQDPKMHFHELYEVLLCMSNAGSIFIDGDSFPMKAGTICLIKNGVLHRIEITCDDEVFVRYVLQFPAEVIENFFTEAYDFSSIFPGNYTYISMLVDEYEQIKKLFNRIYYTSANSLSNNLKRDISFLEMLYSITDKMSDGVIQSQATNMSSYVRLKPILSYIQEHLEEHLSLDMLSKQFFLSKHYLCHMFKSVTGFGIAEYIIRSRLIRACTLLRNGVNVQTAGECSGFQNNAHFIKTFSKTMKLSPGRYAKKYKVCKKI